ncbi:MAG: hypothetical protein WC873_04905, partial [Candidatus Gracilibacteria bacterium]
FFLHSSDLNLDDGINASDEDYQFTFTGQTEKSDYYRQITVTSADTNLIEFTVTIEWLDGAKVGRQVGGVTTVKNDQ